MIAKKIGRARNVALLLAVVPALAGCKLLGLDNGFASTATLQERLPADFGAEQLAVGRKALQDGHIVDAIESFQLAKFYPEHAAAAANGLAVAYSQLGRTDLTERYFQVAVALAPEDERYRSNLARFYARNPIPKSADPAAALAAMQAFAPMPMDAPVDNAIGEVSVPATARAAGVSVEAAGTRVRRVSRNEVFISDAPVAAESLRPVSRRHAVIELGARTARRPVVRVGLQTASRARRPAYPVRTELTGR